MSNASCLVFASSGGGAANADEAVARSATIRNRFMAADCICEHLRHLRMTGFIRRCSQVNQAALPHLQLCNNFWHFRRHEPTLSVRTNCSPVNDVASLTEDGMNTRWNGISLGVLISAAPGLIAQERASMPPAELARSAGCLKCHSIDK